MRLAGPIIVTMAAILSAQTVAAAPPTWVAKWLASDMAGALPARRSLPAAFEFAGRRFEFERSTLADVTSIAGGHITVQGDAGDVLAWVCYSLDSNQVVWVMSGELGGVARAINSLAVTPGREPGCAPLERARLVVSAPGIGASAAQVTRWFGASGSVFKETIGGPGGGTRLRVLAYRVVGGKIAAYVVSQVTAF